MQALRLIKLEASLGAKIPPEYLAFLASHSARDEAGLVVSSNPDYWGVRSFFEIGSGEDSYQLDKVYSQVGDVLPAGALPIADDWAGNLYCLFCSGPSIGHVVWWNHERDHGDSRTDLVASSFQEFVSSLRRDEA
jgi:hypothetical protein